MSTNLFKVKQPKQLCLNMECSLPVPNEHFHTRPRDLEILSTGCTVTEILFFNLKWLLLSSRLQASCCPRCWSLRSKMRLPQCCESRPTRGEKREEKNWLYCARLIWHVQGHLFYCYHIPASTFLILNVPLPAGIKVRCTLSCCSSSHHTQSANCIFIGFEHGFCIDLDMQILFMKSIYIYMWCLQIKCRRRKFYNCYIVYWLELSDL